MAAYFSTVKYTITQSFEHLTTMKNLWLYESSGNRLFNQTDLGSNPGLTAYYLWDFISFLNLSVSNPVLYQKL